MRVLVFLGANKGNSPEFEQTTREVGKWIGENGHSLIYGGNANGLMGVLADSALEFGANVVGVMPEFLMDEETPHEGLSEFVTTKTMQDRKDYMRANADICIALPGGAGTMEEITEAISLYRVKQSNCPCVFFNKNGYYDLMRDMYDKMVEFDFLKEKYRKDILFSDDFNEIENFYKEKRQD